MKGIFVLAFIFLVAGVQTYSQVNDSLVARHQTRYVKDSLSLSEQQGEEIFKINLKARQDKKKIWEKYRNTRELQLRMQEVDRRKDSLYQSVLGEEKYRDYDKKRRNNAFITN